MLFLRVIAWYGAEKISLKKSCFYLYIRRPDGRYMARAQVAGKSVLLYGWKLRALKKEFAEAVEEARKGSIWLG